MATVTRTVARAGELVCCDKGEYSDYTVVGFFVVLKEFDPALELEAFLGANEDDREPYSFDSYKFLAHLTAQGYLLDVSYSTLYLGSYSDAKSVVWQPKEA